VAEIAAQPQFDRIARVYRAMEYLSLGPMLERCRFYFVPRLVNCRHALVLGDGDGRFAARLLAASPHLQAEAVDLSTVMLGLLRRRVSREHAEDRLTTTCADARSFEPASSGYDLIATHFFLDCLTEPEAHDLIARLRPHLASGAQWVVSEFQIPEAGRVRVWLARAIITGLYAAFRLLTGLTVRQIPPWRTLLSRHGFVRKDTRSWVGGLLVAELWELPEATLPRAARSHQP
jgi:ubiquinone/menaquinone biosynthesis C-methylase UbiE